ncbi:ecdysteroid-phosphate phosphatase [Patella vulgata]|uniref:ecdysteroid-phosphate phosphatase n=1 Tax=Patella vulgata TaxID=6465 RepID=UPI0021804ACF|nr:ecdysteroid-phosphate phosphatase [Patella vulgata]
MAAAAVPPRIIKKEHKSKTDCNGKEAIDVLLQMGFPKNRALKAIATTGDKGVQLASDWLLSHVNDKTLDEKIDREYILYLCPVGELQAELTAFWEKSQNLCGWNGAHSYFPHVTLCPFFKADDRHVPFLAKTLSNLEPKVKNCPENPHLEFFAQQNFIGLFIGGSQYEYFKNIVLDYSAALKKEGIIMEAPKKQFHITCAYQYKPEHHETLMKLAKEINVQAEARWSIRLYSRDPKIAHSEVRRVLRPYHKDLADELDLITDDYMIIDPAEVTKSKDGWYSGLSWVSGNQGMFPGSFTKKTAETWTWTLHKDIPIGYKMSESNHVNGEYGQLWESKAEQKPDSKQDPKDLYAKVCKIKKKLPPAPRRLFVMRHGERVDFCIGRDWMEKCFDQDGKYKQINLNLPRVLMKRHSHLEYNRDGPLTEIGKYQAKLTGEALKNENVVISHVFASPALRCVQTAQAVIEGLGIDIKMSIEPSLFEWLGWYQPICPQWISPEDFSKNGYSVNTAYAAYLTVKNLNMDETVEECYNRGANFSRFVIKKFPSESGNILFVGHAGSLDICTRQICGRAPRGTTDFHSHLSSIPYCGICMCQEEPTSKKWALVDCPVKPLNHSANKSFNWKTVLTNHMAAV